MYPTDEFYLASDAAKMSLLKKRISEDYARAQQGRCWKCRYYREREGCTISHYHAECFSDANCYRVVAPGGVDLFPNKPSSPPHQFYVEPPDWPEKFAQSAEKEARRRQQENEDDLRRGRENSFQQYLRW